jgi:hypothetical protein
MRHKGNISYVNEQRNKIIPELFRQAVVLAPVPSSPIMICEKAVELPTKEFYVSFDAALCYIRKRYYHNKHHTFSSRYKQKLYEALYEKFVELKQLHEEMLLTDVVSLALGCTAPCLGLSPSQFYTILLKYQKKMKNSPTRFLPRHHSTFHNHP